MFVCLYVCMFVCMFVKVKADKKRMCKSCCYILPCPLGSTLNMEVKVLKRDLHIYYYWNSLQTFANHSICARKEVSKFDLNIFYYGFHWKTNSLSLKEIGIISYKNIFYNKTNLSLNAILCEQYFKESHISSIQWALLNEIKDNVINQLMWSN